ncbi:MAG TPA: cytidylate kinase-like family protein [Gemmatimonadales bacterium]|jgi:cytidylate kinase|nr:cytidylate kinase-like family protein [Gemmatimonadales bacterium]
MIITVSRQFGAGGSEVARRVAQELGWRLVDNELVDRVAERAGLPPDEVAQRDESAPGFVERLVRVLTRSVPELFPKPAEKVPEPEEATLVRVTETVVAELAAEGRVVLVGRAGPAVLRGKYDALHIKIVAPIGDRLRTAAERLGVAPRDAEKVLQETDANRARYLKQHYGRDWNDSTNYDMVLNSGTLGLPGTTAVVVAEARRRWALTVRSER